MVFVVIVNPNALVRYKTMAKEEMVIMMKRKVFLGKITAIYTSRETRPVDCHVCSSEYLSKNCLGSSDFLRFLQPFLHIHLHVRAKSILRLIIEPTKKYSQDTEGLH